MHTKKVLASFLAVVLIALSTPLMGGVAASEGKVFDTTAPTETEDPYETDYPYDTTFEFEPVWYGPTVSLETYELTEDKWIVDLYVEDTYGTGISDYAFELYYNPEVMSFADAESIADTAHRTSDAVDNYTVIVISIANDIFPYEKTLLWRIEFDIVDAQDGSELGIFFNHENVVVTAQSGQELASMTSFTDLEEVYSILPTEHTFEIVDGVLKSYSGPGGEVVIPEGVTEIWDNAFYQQSNVTSVVIPEGVTKIGSFAFCECTSLTDIHLPNTLIELEPAAFAGCTSLTSIDIPEGVTIFNYSLFAGCSSLTTMTVPNSVTVITDYVFKDCTSLEKIVIPKSVRMPTSSAGVSVQEYNFENCPNVTIHCYKDSEAHLYAEGKNIPYVLLDGEDEPITPPVSVKIPTVDGDMNSDDTVNLSDVSILLKHIAGWIETGASIFVMEIADVTGDMQVTLADVSLVLKYIAGWNVTLV